MPNLARLDPCLDRRARTCRAIVETPKGGRGKLAYDPKTGAFELKRLLPDGMSFPLDFGFVPGTVGEDGDPIDIMVLNDEPGLVGMLVTVRLIGVIEAEQTEDGRTVRNDRLLGVAEVSHLFREIRTVRDLQPKVVENLCQFWVNYERLRGVGFEVLGVKPPTEAVRLLAAGT